MRFYLELTSKNFPLDVLLKNRKKKKKSQKNGWTNAQQGLFSSLNHSEGEAAPLLWLSLQH